MAAKSWFTIRSSKDALIVYLVSADDVSVVNSVAVGINGNPIVERLSWQDLHELTGCVIPVGSNTKDLASGNFMLTKVRKPDIVLWPL